MGGGEALQASIGRGEASQAPAGGGEASQASIGGGEASWLAGQPMMSLRLLMVMRKPSLMGVL